MRDNHRSLPILIVHSPTDLWAYIDRRHEPLPRCWHSPLRKIIFSNSSNSLSTPNPTHSLATNLSFNWITQLNLASFYMSKVFLDFLQSISLRRFRMRTVGDMIEPWMYPEATLIIRGTIKLKYELVPYSYFHALGSHITANPPRK